VVAELAGVAGGGGDAEAFLAHGHGGVVDALDVDVVFVEEQVGGFLCERCVADEHGDDVGWVGHYGDVAGDQGVFDGSRVELLETAVALVFHLVFDGGFGASHGGGGEGGREDESWSQGTDRVNHLCGAGDVAAYATVGFSKRAGEDVYAVHDCAARTAGEMSLVVQMFGYTCTVWSVHAYGVDFIEKGQGAVFLG
jgi:hypothetical protein